jgi:Ni/Fe-hydrogenase subunit HybB-like protein
MTSSENSPTPEIPETPTLPEKSPGFFTPFNVIATLILIVGIPICVYRFIGGLGAVTNLSDNNPFGMWIAFDVLTGVALAAGGYTLGFAVYIFRLREYHPVIRPAILTAFLGYFLVGVGLFFDVGRPWRMPYPFVVSQGYTSVMFEVAACVLAYLTVLFLEFLPVALEWLRLPTMRRFFLKLTVGLTILGIVLSTLHQSSLGSLFLIAKCKIHPLWYSPYIGVFFFVSSAVAGLSMVIFESSLTHKVFAHRLNHDKHAFDHDRIVLGLGRAASMILFGYFGIKLLGIANGDHWHLLGTPYGAWYLVELLGFVLLPCLMYAVASRKRNVRLVKITSVIAVLGIVLNRFNVSIIAFNWQLPSEDRYYPHFFEIMVSLTLVTAGLVMFKWIVNRMPVLSEHPNFPDEED